MRRATSLVALSLMLIVIAGTAVSAKGQGGTAAVTFSASAEGGVVGTSLSVSAVVHNATPGSTFSAEAVVQFQTGWVTVNFNSGEAATKTARLTKSHGHHRHHHHWWWHHHHRPGPKPTPQPGVDLSGTKSVPINGEETQGTVDIDVTITYGDQVVTLHTSALVKGYGD